MGACPRTNAARVSAQERAWHSKRINAASTIVSQELEKAPGVILLLFLLPLSSFVHFHFLILHFQHFSAHLLLPPGARS